MAATRTNHSSDDLAGAYPNAQRLLWAGFMAILAAGVGFAIRGGILDNWREQFGFTASQVACKGAKSCSHSVWKWRPETPSRCSGLS
jgi:hypothetical protein